MGPFSLEESSIKLIADTMLSLRADNELVNKSLATSLAACGKILHAWVFP